MPAPPFARKPWLARLSQGTPTLPLRDEPSGCTLWLKLEYTLPSGSTKDRVAACILGHAVESGTLREDTVVVEASSGSTSIALAMACAVLGVRFRAVMPEGVSDERVLILRRYGAEVVLTPEDQGMRGALDATVVMAAEDRRVFLTRQFDNPLNVLAHQRGTGPELLAQVGGTVHAFVAGVGTGGTIVGVAAALREAGHPVQVVQVRPSHGRPFAGQPEVCGGIPGVVDGLSGLLDDGALELAGEVVVPDVVAVATARELAGLGLPVGPSSGLNVAGARLVARRLGPGHNVATVLCDRMERYFSTSLFADLREPARERSDDLTRSGYRSGGGAQGAEAADHHARRPAAGADPAERR